MSYGLHPGLPMREHGTFKPPEITEADTLWVPSLLGLSESAFCGGDGTDPRQAVLKSMEQIDIAACPGSGKTTLLVAKLAILASKWRYRTRGICVLSHTNAAQREVEMRLGNTTTGGRLRLYPHFIGTIHGFVNEFLAIPWLRSQRYSIRVIDTDICELRRWNKLDYKWRYSLQQKYVDRADIRIRDARFNLAKKKGKFPFKDNTDTYRNLRDACKEIAREGYHCYDDMFVWAYDLMDKVPDVVHVIRDRFPLLFVDEAQDNSEVQSAILHRIFLDGGSAVIRQRFGDGNQAIFDSVGTEEARTDKFPDDAVKKDLPNSHRFGQKIADLADPLGVTPYGLVGQGPKILVGSDPPKGQHTIFVFDDNSAIQVLDAYGELLLETFSERELRDGIFTAVGQVHRPPSDDGKAKFPHYVGHYWPAYEPDLARRDPTPRAFVQYAFAGQRNSEATGEAYLAVEKIAEGILRLVGMVSNKASIHHRRHNHRNVMRLLDEHTDVRESYEELVATYCVRRDVLTKESWDHRWCDVIRTIAETIAESSSSGPEVDEFLAWKNRPDDEPTQNVGTQIRDNIFRYPSADPKVHIRIGSIHSIKGETHTATLVCETFWNKYNLEKLSQWITGDRMGWTPSDGTQQLYRMKVHYVAVTRPTHLLCLAMKRTCLETKEGDLDQDAVDAIKRHGWQIRWVRQNEPAASGHVDT